MSCLRNGAIRSLLLVAAVVGVFGVLAIGRDWWGHAPLGRQSPGASAATSMSQSDPDHRDSLSQRSATRTTTGGKLILGSQGEKYAQAPDFERETMNGSTLHLSSFRGSVIVLNFWATWCAPCRVEIPAFITMQREMDGVQFIGISLDEEGFEAVRPYAEEMGITYPLVIGDDSLAATFGGVVGLPTSYVLDRKGRIRQRFVGVVHEDTLRSALTDLLADET